MLQQQQRQQRSNNTKEAFYRKLSGNSVHLVKQKSAQILQGLSI
jgi:hypothetical protein